VKISADLIRADTDGNWMLQRAASAAATISRATGLDQEQLVARDGDDRNPRYTRGIQTLRERV
jgi:hypothetical protein